MAVHDRLSHHRHFNPRALPIGKQSFHLPTVQQSHVPCMSCSVLSLQEASVMAGLPLQPLTLLDWLIQLLRRRNCRLQVVGMDEVNGRLTGCTGDPPYGFQHLLCTLRACPAEG
jgi:hypothetical protein